MNKREFTEEVANRCMVTKYVVDEIFNVSSGLIIEKMIGDENIDIPYIGKFALKEKGTTTYKNLFGGKEKTVDKMIYPVFKISDNIKNRIKNGHISKKRV